MDNDMMDKVRHMVDENMDIHGGYDDGFGDWLRLTRHVGCGWMTETERFLVDRLLETELAGSSACKSKNTESKIKLLVCQRANQRFNPGHRLDRLFAFSKKCNHVLD